MWAVLGDPELRGGGWQAQSDAFYASGRAELAATLERVHRLVAEVPTRSALDFGCGVARLTCALAERFDRVIGMDHAAGMLERAQVAARERGVAPEFIDAAWPSATDERFDLVWCCLVIQHQPSRYDGLRLVRELAERVGDGGVLYCQVPVHLPVRRRLQPRRRLYGLVRRLGVSHEAAFNRLGLNPIRMIALPERSVRNTVAAAGLRVVDSVYEALPSGEIDVRLIAARVR